MRSSDSYEPDAAESDPSGFMLARIDDALLRPPVVVDPDTPIGDAYRQLKARHADCLLVDNAGRLGIVTGTDLLDSLVVDGLPQNAPIGPVATYDPITLAPGDHVYRALVLMTRHNIERIVVAAGGELYGILELNDVLSQFATQSHALGIRIERAESVDELAAVARSLTPLTRSLVERGATIRFIMELLAALNGRTMARLFEMLVPETVRSGICLVVMGSEGRGEQILKTDQDNAVILSNDLHWPDCQAVLNRFSATLGEFGYPPCPGNIMVSNPAWVMTLDGWQQRLEGWLRAADGDAMLNLTITSDMHAVAGNADLYRALNRWLLERFSGGSGFFPTFVQAAMQFALPLNFFGNLKGADIDVKKGGIFPLVHGVRALALENGIPEANTFARVEALVAADVLDPRQGDDLAVAFSTLNALRLREQLRRLDDGQDGDNLVHVAELDTLDRDRLRDALSAVKRFRGFLTRHFHVSR